MKRILAAVAFVFIGILVGGFALAQSGLSIANLPFASVPLAGTEYTLVLQGGKLYLTPVGGVGPQAGTQNINKVFASPASGSAGAPTFRALVAADLPVSGGIPQGRLTLTSGSPVMSADVSAATAIYYAAYTGLSVPLYNGSATALFAIGGGQISLALSTSNHLNANLYDIVAFNNSGTLTLCTLPAWSSQTARASAIDFSLGYWTNTLATSHCYNGATDYGVIGAHQATYLGTFWTTANGQTAMQFKPTSASGGTNNVVGLYNAYNRVRFTAQDRNSTGNYQLTTNATWTPLFNSTSDRITYVDGLAQSPVDVTLNVANLVTASAIQSDLGVSKDSASAAPTQVASFAPVTANAGVTLSDRDAFAASLGLHYLQGMMYTTGTTGGSNDRVDGQSFSAGINSSVLAATLDL